MQIHKKNKAAVIKKDLNKLINEDSKNQSHPSEIALLLNELPLSKSINKYHHLPKDQQIAVFPYLGIYSQKQMFKQMPDQQKYDILDQLNSVDRHAFLMNVKGIQRSELVTHLNAKNRKTAEKMMGYAPHSVGHLLNTNFVTLKKEMTIEAALEFLKDHQPDEASANVLYVVDGKGKLIDDVPLRKLVLNNKDMRVEEVMDHDYICLNVNEPINDAIGKFEQYNRVVLPVTTTDKLLLGIVTIDDIMDAAQRRGTREMHRFGGVESLEYPYVKTPLFSLIWKRAGWLIILFLSEMLTATAMGHYQKEIAKAVVLALFVPLVISSGGNSGSQAATLIIRAMAVRELTVKKWWYVMRREILSGLTLGLILGCIGFLRIALWQQLGWYNYGQHWPLMGVTILFSLTGIVMWGTLIGSMIPILLKRLKFDPATSSAPFVATLVDVTGLIIYFTIAAIILNGTLL